MKIIVTLLFIFIYLPSNSQDKALKFHIEYEEMKMKEKGEWSEWNFFGDINEDMNSNILIDFSNNSVTWDYRFKQDDRKFSSYNIISRKEDTTYEDVNFYATYFRVKQDKDITNYELCFFGSDKEPYYILLTKTPLIETRYYLKKTDK
ncbi:MAG TPA: hypothetical protein VGI82_00140 [Chitinophagaceae bacterium]